MKIHVSKRTFRPPVLSGLLGACLVLSMGLALPQAAMAWGQHKPTGCEQAARKMFSSCRLESLEDYNATLANCDNFYDRDERNDCRRDALDELRSANEECEEQYDERRGVCDLLDEDRYDPDPLTDRVFQDPDNPTVTNRYFSLQPGDTSIFRVYEDGERTDEVIVVRVTDEIRYFYADEESGYAGVPCRVVVDAAMEEGEDDEDGGTDYTALELTDDWYALDTVGNIYYCGELSRNYEDGTLTDLDGSFQAGVEYAKAGTLLRAMFPGSGVADRQEYALGEAEDVVVYLNDETSPDEEIGYEPENPDFACDDTCLQTRDLNPNDPGGYEVKFYVPDVGFVLAAVFEGDAIEGDGEYTGEREELVCTFTGPMPDASALEACGVEDGAELLEDLCELAPDAFCDDDDEE